MRLIKQDCPIGQGTALNIEVQGPMGTAERVYKSKDIHFLGYKSTTAIRVCDVLIDIGCSITRLRWELKKINAVCITHKHSDHVTERTLKWLAKHHPEIPIYGNADVRQEYGDFIKVVDAGELIQTERTSIIPYEGLHTVPVYMYVLQNRTTKKTALVATDTQLHPVVWQKWWKGKIDILIGEYRYIKEWVEILKCLTIEGADKLRAYHHQPPRGVPIDDIDLMMLTGHASKEELMTLWEWCKREDSSPLIRIGHGGTLYCD